MSGSPQFAREAHFRLVLFDCVLGKEAVLPRQVANESEQRSGEHTRLGMKEAMASGGRGGGLQVERVNKVDKS